MNRTNIKVDDQEMVLVSGKTLIGKNESYTTGRLATSSRVVYETNPVQTSSDTTNAVYMNWGELNPNSQVTIKARVHDGEVWSNWYDATADPNEKPDTVRSSLLAAFIVAPKIADIQYQIDVESKDGSKVEINLVDNTFQSIDTTAGPSLTRKSILSSIASLLGGERVSARENKPNIITREAWGCPEPNDSEWPPEYAKINRTVIHHTAVIPGGDTAASVRAIWQYHAKSLQWGDIGYNYLVDQYGSIFHGRYTDEEYARQNNVDVVGGHAYGNNVGTVGVGALGEFNTQGPTTSLVHSMGEIAAYKMGKYGLNPAGGETYGGNLLSHRDLMSTSCPGANLYANIQTIRNVASALFPRYNVPKYAWQYVAQHSFLDADRTKRFDAAKEKVQPGMRLYLTLEAINTGTATWERGSATSIRLGTSNPRDRKSILCDPGLWITCNRPAEIAEGSVKPGQMGSFMFEVTIPEYSEDSPYLKEYFNLLAEGATWMNSPGQHWQFTYAPPYQWQLESSMVYRDAAHTQEVDPASIQVKEGDRLYVVLLARNTGSKTWRSSGLQPTKIGTTNPRDGVSVFCTQSWSTCNRPATVSEDTAPGETGTFSFDVIVPVNSSPNQPVIKNEHLNLLTERVVWMNDIGYYLQFVIHQP